MFEKVYLKEKYLHLKKKIYIKNRTDTLNILVLVVSLIVDLDNQTKSFMKVYHCIVCSESSTNS